MKAIAEGSRDQACKIKLISRHSGINERIQYIRTINQNNRNT